MILIWRSSSTETNIQFAGQFMFAFTLLPDDRTIAAAMAPLGSPGVIHLIDTATMKVIDLGGGRSRLEWSSTWEPDGASEADALKVVEAMHTGVLAVMKTNLEKR